MVLQLYKGSQLQKKIYKGNTRIKYVYKGSQMIWRLYDPSPIRFEHTGNFQTYVVPTGVGHLKVDCVAARGTNQGANGGRVQCTLQVTEGQKLYIYVGANGGNCQTPIYNASDIRTNNAGITDTTSLQSRLVVAGGGGSKPTSATSVSSAGAGGGTTGANATGTQGGKGGTQTDGGNGGNNVGGGVGGKGQLGLGGSSSTFYSFAGGAGGAGWYGGGGGSGYFFDGYYGNYGAGGGGSSYTHPTLCTGVTHTQGFTAADAGYIILTPMD